MRINEYGHPRIEYNNSTDAFLALVDCINNTGASINGKYGVTKEINSVSFSLTNPLARVYIIPRRKNNIFATIAETLWVLAGRNDIDFLVRYLPRASEFSKDGETWSTGYGPRIRSWHGSVDQVGEIYRLLKYESISRRAVISLFDPEIDFQNDKDAPPCNNWLNFICRNNSLNTNIAIRSNDLFWGFSGINTFEWSLLQEIIAYWINVDVGQLHFFIGSLHYYERHFMTASEITRNNVFTSAYQYGFDSPRFCTSFDKFDKELQELFTIERLMRIHKWDFDDKYEMIKDPLLRLFLQLMGAYNYYLEFGLNNNLGRLFADIAVSDLRLAGIEYFTRRFKTLDWVGLNQTENMFLSQFDIR